MISFVLPASTIASPCAVDLTQLARLQNMKNVLLVDTRDLGDFQNFHIPGSINMSLDELNTHAFLGKRQIILIDNGWREVTQKDCRLGRKHIKRLSGGIAAWRLYKYQTPSSQSLWPSVYVSSGEVFQTDQSSYLAISLQPVNKQLRTVFPGVLYWAEHKSRSVDAKLRANKALAILVIDADESTGAMLQVLYRRYPGHRIYLLKGGWKSYAQYQLLVTLKQQAKQKPSLQQKVLKCK